MSKNVLEKWYDLWERKRKLGIQIREFAEEESNFSRLHGDEIRRLQEEEKKRKSKEDVHTKDWIQSD